MPIPRIIVSATLPAKPPVVFEALTSSRAMRFWTGQSGAVSKSVGGPFRMFDSWVTGHVLAYKPGKLLMVTWRVSEWPKTTPPSLVRYDLASHAKGTRLRITHDGLPSVSERDSHREGWKEYVIDPLKGYLAHRL